MSASGGNGPPAKKLKIGDGGGGKSPLRNLRQTYLQILRLMLVYRDEFGVFPSANSPEFCLFVETDGLVNISHERLTQALLFMEETFRDNVRLRGMNINFVDGYRDERFRLSRRIWGPRNDDHENVAVVENPADLDDDVDEAQDAMDTAILRALNEFITGNGGAIPEPDSVEFYNFLVNLIPNIPQDLSVDRILMLEENFNRIEANRMMGDIEEFANPQRREIYDLSSTIWGHDDAMEEQYDGAQVIDDGENGQDFGGDGNAGDEQNDQGAGVGNGDEQDGQGGAGDGGGEEDGEGGVGDGGVNEDDLGGVED